jgi:hypothetical protein
MSYHANPDPLAGTHHRGQNNDNTVSKLSQHRQYNPLRYKNVLMALPTFHKMNGSVRKPFRSDTSAFAMISS